MAVRTRLRRQAENLGVADQVHFLGTREDVASLLTVADLFVLPSVMAGMPLALLEAMAAAKPIVATAVAGTAEAILLSQIGLLVPPGDSQALAEGISRLLRDPVQARVMGQAARRHAEATFGAEKNAAEHMALHRRLRQLGAGA